MKHRRALAATLLSTAALTVSPTLASAEPSSSASAKPAKGGSVIDGPDIAAGAQNAPGTAAIHDIINALGIYTLLGCLAALLLSGLILVLGPRFGFSQASTVGKVGIVAALGVAFLVGISATLINYFYNAGA